VARENCYKCQHCLTICPTGAVSILGLKSEERIPLALIALSYFELFAQANGVGAVWCGLAKYAIDDILPGTRTRLGIPDDHVFGYAMLFGMPTASFARTAQHRPALIHRVE
jgi:ferredoxin